MRAAIVGGGPSSVCILQAALRHIAGDNEVDITVFEPSSLLWHGRVFQPDRGEVLANAPMVDMSVRAWDRADRIVRDIAATVDQHSRTGAANAH